MSRHHCVCWLIACALLGCDEDPARSVKIIARPAASVKPKAARQALENPIPTWQPSFCPPPRETKHGPGTFVANGACSFEHHGFVDCTALNDDFIVSFIRPAKQAAEVALFINVEHYTGPGKYDYVQLLISVNHPTGPFRWRSEVALATVDDGQKSITFEPIRLEPLLTRGTGGIDISGTLWCRPNGARQ